MTPPQTTIAEATTAESAISQATVAQTLLQDFDREMAGTRRTLERIPTSDHTLIYRPHAKSMAMGRLAAHVATLPQLVPLILEHEALHAPGPDWPPNLEFSSTEDLLADFDRLSARARAALAAASDVQLQAHWQLFWGSMLAVEGTRTFIYRSVFFNHLIHHRAQLGVYLRLNEIPVPALYGPSADER